MASSDRYHPRPGGQSIKEVFSCFVFFSVALLESWGLGKIVSSCGISRKSPRPLHPPSPSLPFFLAIAATSNSFLFPLQRLLTFLTFVFVSPFPPRTPVSLRRPWSTNCWLLFQRQAAAAAAEDGSKKGSENRTNSPFGGEEKEESREEQRKKEPLFLFPKSKSGRYRNSSATFLAP